jgi:RNA polymerase sigma factor for flagellar operon FliA
MNEKLIVDYIPLANSIAFKKKKVLPKKISLDELKSAAYYGLIDAANKFNPKIGSFYCYASIRINGAIKDHLRFLGNFGKNDIVESYFFEKDNLSTLDFFEYLATKLEEKEFDIIKMYYLESKTMTEIAEIKNLSESRISQIISKLHKKLKIKLKGTET